MNGIGFTNTKLSNRTTSFVQFLIHTRRLEQVWCVLRGKWKPQCVLNQSKGELNVATKIWDLYMLCNDGYRTRFGPFYRDLCLCVESRNDEFLYSETAACDMSTLEIDGSVGVILCTNKISRRKEFKGLDKNKYTYKTFSFVAVRAMKNDYGAPVPNWKALSSSTDQDCIVTAIITHWYESYQNLKQISSQNSPLYQEGTAGAPDVAWNDSVSTQSVIVSFQSLKKSEQISATGQNLISRDGSVTSTI